jgi:uncharacterized protein DUF1549/uncharacterized protein DUF1553
MNRPGKIPILATLTALSFWGLILSRADDNISGEDRLPVAHPECTAFGANREKMVRTALRSGTALSSLTRQVTLSRAAASDGSRPRSFAAPQPDSIDSYLWVDMQANGVQPADKTTDWEFIRRVTLDLTGRIPTPARVLSFVADSAPDKRARLIEELLSSPQWVDKWTMYFGDLYKSTDFRPSTSLRRFPQGRNAFYQWIHDSLAGNKPYDQMATQLITARGENSYQQGELNWMLNGYITGGPAQDITDSQATNVAETFLGISHMNCLLCHNGRGHLDALTVWGASTTRAQAWQFASFLSRTSIATVRFDPTNNNVYYWSVADNVNHDYQLGTTTGNRPARAPLPTCAPGKTCYVAPAYIFTGDTPKAGENYRAALARLITGDFQFARASVNYIWAQFFGRGIVDPPNQFDPARLDPDNPPPDPWTLQPSNPRLLNALAQHFIDHRYDLKALMREIANTDAYQLSSRYNGAWNPAWEPLFARKFVRRLWGEEIHDAVAQSSGVMPAYKIANFSDQGFGTIAFAMQMPDVVNMPGGAMTPFLDSFLRGDRDANERRGEGSVQQALNLMNDPFLAAHIGPAGANGNQLITRNLTGPNDQLVQALYLGILSRYPTDSEMSTALAAFESGSNKASVAQNLTWALYNKVDFVFNY